MGPVAEAVFKTAEVWQPREANERLLAALEEPDR
jgi:hypothetical protein